MPKDDFFTLHGLIDNLTEYLNLTPEQQFRVTAKIKRLIHHEKADLFNRYSLYSQGIPIFDRNDSENAKVIGHEPPQDPWLHGIMTNKAKQHAVWAKFLDEEIVTWNVGTHKFVQKLGSCDDCASTLDTKVGYVRLSEGEKKQAYCNPCADRRGLLEKRS